tara:strand:- start:48 stop:344 length:297 start_codon:yes stop_codon:yes gene_type:complete
MKKPIESFKKFDESVKPKIDFDSFSNNETRIVVRDFFDWIDLTLDKSCCNENWSKNYVKNNIKSMLDSDYEAATEAWQKVINKANWTEVGNWLRKQQK